MVESCVLENRTDTDCWFAAVRDGEVIARSKSFRPYDRLNESAAWDHLTGSLLNLGWREVSRGPLWWQRSYERPRD